MAILTGFDEGVRLQGPVTNLAVAAVANAVAIFQLSNWNIPAGGQMVGTKSVRIKRIKMMNNAAGNQVVMIGTGVGAAFAALLPGLVSLNNLNEDFVEEDLPQVEAFADITAYPVALVAAGTIDVQIEVEEIG